MSAFGQLQADLDREQRMARLMSACCRLIVRATDATALMQDVCQTLVDVAAYGRAWITSVDPDDPTVLRQQAQAGHDDPLFASMPGLWTKPDKTPTLIGATLQAGNAYVVDAIASDPAFYRWRVETKLHPYGAFLALPLMHKQNLWGMLAIYTIMPAAFPATTIQLLSDLADDLVYRIVQLQAQSTQLTEETSILSQAALLQQVSDAVIVTDANFIVQSWNKAAERMYGWHADEAIGQRVGSLIKQEFPHSTPEDILRNFWTNTHWEDEVIQYHRDGRALHILASVTVVRDATGGPASVIAINRDISERKQIEIALRTSETKFRTLAETMTAGTSIFDNDRWIYANPALERITGYTHAELLTMNIWDLVAPEGREEIHQRALRRQRGEAVPDRYEFKIITRQGEERWIDLTASRIELDGGIKVLTTSHDITALKHVEAELKQINATLEQRIAERTAALEQHSRDLAFSEATLRARTRTLRAILDSMGDGVVVVNTSGQVLLCNPTAKNLLGFDFADIAPEQWAERGGFYLPDMKTPYPLSKNPLQKAMCGLSSDRVEVFVQHSRLPSAMWFGVNARPLVDETGMLHGGVAVFHDITARKRAEDDLWHSLQQMDQLSRASAALIAADNTTALLRAFALVLSETNSAILALYALAHTTGQPKQARLMACLQKDNPVLVPSEAYTSVEHILLGKHLLAPPYQIVSQSDNGEEQIGIHAAMPNLMSEQAMRASLLVPLVSRNNRLVGCVTVAWPTPRILTAFEHQLCQTLAPQLATLVENQHLLHQAQESEARYRLMTENATDMISRHSLDGVFLYASLSCQTLLGYTPEELVGRSLYDLFHPDDLEAIRAELVPMQDVLTAMPAVSYRIQHKNGTYVWFETMSRVIYDQEREQPQEIVGVSRDITDRKRSEMARVELTQRNEALVQAIGDVVYEHVMPADRMHWSGNYIEMFGYDANEIVPDSDSWLGKIYLADLPRVLAEFDAAIAENRPHDLEYRFKHHNKHYIWVHDRGVLYVNESGELERIIGVMRDISARKHAEEELQQRTLQLEVINKELEAFSYSVSHDLRAPLRSINGFSGALQEDYAHLLDEAGVRYLACVRTASENMGNLIDDLLSLSRVTRSDMCRTEIDLGALAQSVLADMRSIQPEREVEVQVAQNILAHADAELVRVVLVNLLGNAWKFTAKCTPAQIEFGMMEMDQAQVYFVRDNGAGFDMAYADKLFGAFQRLHSASEFSGTGIGLATVQRIVHRHGGRVWAEGAVDQGATFFFTL